MLRRKILLAVTLFSIASGSNAASLADVSQALITSGSILQKLMWAACIVVGILLIAAAFTQFQIHRRNPKLVPLTTPVLYLILGIVAIAIPFTDTMGGFRGAKIDQLKSTPGAKKEPQQYINPNDIDAPIYK